ncbi:MAG: menaquinone biosynthesis protein [Bacteroidetes bacterium]|nr:menaquinone biosynthesis protein [Bacteroidota bacterium]
MQLIKISAVSYLNTFPFVFGLKESGLLQNFSLELDVPSVCAEKLKNDRVDIALVPAGALPEMGKFHYISDFCIGAVGAVKTVLLLSKVPLEQIKHIYLDFDSRTSVELVKVLAKKHWHINPQWENLMPGQTGSLQDVESLVAIGDKTFELRPHFPFVYDLAEAWISFSGLPFVFAVWISRKRLPDSVLVQFTRSLAYGISHKQECIEYFRDKLPGCGDCLDYLENNISYEFDDRKKEGLDLFLKSIYFLAG